jgi:NAD(P)-dependent dehydrogenase (short-subunit alcohol dehydrogenase family)
MRHVALITGGSRGLGATLAAFLAAQDYDLVLTSRHADELEAASRAIAHYGGRILQIVGDVADEDHRQKLVAGAWELGGLDLLINNASELGPSPLPPLADLPLDRLERLLAVNVVAPLGLAQSALPLLQQRQGLIVNLSSDAALGGYPGWGGYGATKAALDLISLTLAAELKEHGVAVVSVDPGDMRTVMHQAAFPGSDISDRPLPEATIPFFAWLLGQEHGRVSGRRYQAQSTLWEIAA